MEPHCDGGSGDFARGGDTSKNLLLRPWQLRHTTVCSSTAPHGDRSQPPRPERERSTRSTTAYGHRSDLSRGRGQEVLQDLEPQVRAATVGYVAAAVLLLAQPVLGGGDTLDAAAVQFFLAQSLLQRQREEEEAAQRLVKEAQEAKYEKKMLVVNRRVRVSPTPAEEAAWRRWMGLDRGGSSSSSSVKKRKKKKRRRKWRRVTTWQYWRRRSLRSCRP